MGYFFRGPYLLYVLVCALLFTSCDKSETEPPNPTISKIPSGRLGDEIVIDGENFELDRLQVFFDNEESQVNYITDTKIKVVIPRTLGRFDPILTIVDLENNNNIVEETFELVTPKITGFDTPEVTFQEQLVVYGENFDTNEAYVSVKVNGTKANIINADYEQLTIRIPEELVDKDLQVSVVAQLQEAVSGMPLTLKQPIITSVTEDFYPGGSFEIYGDNFHPNAGYGKIVIDGVEASISSSSKNTIRIYTPRGPYQEFHANELTYELAGYELTYDLSSEILGTILLVDENPGEFVSKTTVYNGEAFAYISGEQVDNGYHYELFKFTKNEQKWAKVPNLEFEGYLNEITTDNSGNLFVYFYSGPDGIRKLLKINLDSFGVEEYDIPFEENHYTINFLHFNGHLYAQKVRSFDGASYSTETMFRYNDVERLWDELHSEPILDSFERLNSSVDIMFEHNGILYFNHSPQSAVWKGYRLLQDFTLEEYDATFYFSFFDGVFWKYQYHGDLNNFFNQEPGLDYKNIIGHNYFVLDGTIYFQGDLYEQLGNGTYKIREGLINDLL